MSKLVVFDVDGTILNSGEFFNRAILEYSDKNNLPEPCLKTMQKGYSHSKDYDFGWGVDKEEQFFHLKKIFKIFDEKTSLEIPKLYTGVEDTLINLKDEGYTLAIVTAKPEKNLIEIMEHHNVYTLFSLHRCWEDVKRKAEKMKPEPDMLNSVMKELNFVPDETVMIGDTTMDIVMGRNAKAGTIGVTWGYHPKEMLEDAKAHYIVETEVPDIVPVIGMDFE